MKKLTLQEKIKKYYDEHPYVAKYLGTLTNYTCDVRVGSESCQATHIEMIRDWIDKKIEEGKVQKEDI